MSCRVQVPGAMIGARPVFSQPAGTAYVRPPHGAPMVAPHPCAACGQPQPTQPAQLRQSFMSTSHASLDARFEQYRPVEQRQEMPEHIPRQIQQPWPDARVEGRPVVPAQPSQQGSLSLSAATRAASEQFHQAMALLTLDTVCQYVKTQLRDEASVPRQQAPLDVSYLAPDAGSQELHASEVTGGNLNYAFVVRDDKNAVFVKQAPDYIKVIGPEAQLTRERMRLEVMVYQEWVHRGAEISRYIPRIWKFDDGAMAFIMEFLESYQLLQRSLFEGDAQKLLAQQLGETHCSKLDPAEVSRLTSSYENRLLRDIQLEYVFSKCYREDPRAAGLREDAAFMAEVEELKAIYNGRYVQNLALCHGDLHAGSVMVDGPSLGETQQQRDVGSLLSTYVLAYCFHQAQKQPASEMMEAAQKIWEAYVAAMKAADFPSELLQQIEAETLGFIGCEVVRTALGLAFERSLRIEDRLKLEAFGQDWASAEDAALRLGVTCILRRREGMAALTAAIADFAAG
eukprot:s1106_g3.t1